MSFFRTMETQFEDQGCLTGALEDIGLKDKFTVHQTKQKLGGYGRGEAEIVIKRQAFGNHYEAGFAQVNDKFQFVSADDDRFDMKKLKVAYTERKTMALAKAKGMQFDRREKYQDAKGQQHVKLIFKSAALANG